MPRVEIQSKIDPELAHQLRLADENPVEAVFNLEPGPSRSYIPPEEVESVVGHLITGVGDEAGYWPGQEDIHVFRNLGTFMVRAAPSFLLRLADRDEIASASANHQPGEILIRPVITHRPSGSAMA